MNIQWIKFGTMILISTINIIIGINIISKNKLTKKYSYYFILILIFSSVWATLVGLSIISKSPNIFLMIVKMSFSFSTLIFLSFYFFAKEFPYRHIKYSKLLDILIILMTLLILFTIFNNLIIGYKEDISELRWIDNKIFHSIFAAYLLIISLISYYFLFTKYTKSQGIDKKRILIIIIGTMISFLFGIIFVWLLPQINIYNFRWIGPLFIISMQTSIAYLLFKKN